MYKSNLFFLNDFPLKLPLQNETQGNFDGFLTIFQQGNEKFGLQTALSIPGYSILTFLFIFGIVIIIFVASKYNLNGKTRI